jgi:hypothetical protein
LGAGNETVNRRGKNFCPPGVCSLLGGEGRNKGYGVNAVEKIRQGRVIGCVRFQV